MEKASTFSSSLCRITSTEKKLRSTVQQGKFISKCLQCMSKLLLTSPGLHWYSNESNRQVQCHKKEDGTRPSLCKVHMLDAYMTHTLGVSSAWAPTCSVGWPQLWRISCRGLLICGRVSSMPLNLHLLLRSGLGNRAQPARLFAAAGKKVPLPFQLYATTLVFFTTVS